MAVVSFTIPDALVPRLVAAARALYPQYAALSDGATFKAITGDHWRSIVALFESDAAIAKAKADGAGIG